MRYIVSRIRHSQGTATTEATQIAPSAERRAGFSVTITEPDGVLEIFLSSAAGAIGTGIRVTANAPLHFQIPYYNAITARAVEDTVQWQLAEYFF